MSVLPFFYSLKDRLRDPAILTGLLFFLCVLAAVIAPRLLSFVPSLLGAVSTGVGIWVSRTRPRLSHPDIFIMAGLCLIILASAFWSSNPGYGIDKGLRITLTLMAGLLFIDAARQVDTKKILPWLPAALCGLLMAGEIMTLFEHTHNYPLMRAISDPDKVDRWFKNKYNRTEVFFAVSFLPILWMVLKSQMTRRTRYILVIALTALTAAALYHSHSQTAQLSLIVFVLIFLIYPVRYRPVWIASAMLLAAGILFSPWIAQTLYALLPTPLENKGILTAASIPHRIVIWNFIATEALKHPFIGNGLEATRYLQSETILPFVNSTHVLHPHNSFLQIWVEAGLLGITATIGFLLHTLRQIWRWEGPGSRRLGFAMLAGCIMVSLTGFGFWQGYQLGLFIYAAALTVLCVRLTAPPVTR